MLGSGSGARTPAGRIPLLLSFALEPQTSSAEPISVNLVSLKYIRFSCVL